MTVIITSQNNEKIFREKDFIIIGSNSDCDYKINVGYDFMLTLQYDENTNKCTIINNFSNPKILFRGEPFKGKIIFEKFCKLKFENSEEFIGIKIPEKEAQPISQIAQKELTQKEVSELYGNDINTEVKLKLEKKKSDIEKSRVAITKQIAFSINNLKKRLSLNFKASIILNIALVFSTIIMTFGITNYLMGLPISDTVAFMNMPTNIKMLVLFSVLTYAVSLSLKQGIYLFLQNKDAQKPIYGAKFAQNFLIFLSTTFMLGFYTINMIYYINPNGRIFYGALISLFFVMLNATIAFACGYFKYSSQKLSMELDKYEYREDFEMVLNEYQSWIDMFINSLSSVKINYIKDKTFTLQLKAVGEIILGILTAPFLAYGVSNTLAMCFPEAAGWIRISGLRFSPVFLILATMLIIFAFFTIANGFLTMRKISGSDIIKLDGFRNYLSHGVDILGLQNVRSLEKERVRLFIIGVSIIFIEFTMNTSFFMTEIGADLGGLFLSFVAASVPTALLIAETYILSRTNFELYVCDSLISKLDRK